MIVSKRNWINCYPQQIRLGLKKPLSFVFAIFSIPLMEKQLAQLGEHSTSEGSWVRAPHCFFSLLTTSYEKEKTYEIRNFSCIEIYGKNGE